MRKQLFIFILLISFPAIAQTIKVNPTNNILKLDRLKEGTNVYLVYFQDSIDGPKYNMELWERSIKKDESRNVYQFSWDRFFSKGTYINYEIEAGSENFKPISEKILLHNDKENLNNISKRHFIYENGNMTTHANPKFHNGKTFEKENAGNAFNWEMDMETFGMLPLKEGVDFDIKFYHPGSKTPPKYYKYSVVRSESILLNEQAYDCWVLYVEYPGHGKSEFWIDKKSFITLKMEELYDGKYRFKKLIV